MRRLWFNRKYLGCSTYTPYMTLLIVVFPSSLNFFLTSFVHHFESQLSSTSSFSGKKSWQPECQRPKTNGLPKRTFIRATHDSPSVLLKKNFHKRPTKSKDKNLKKKKKKIQQLAYLTYSQLLHKGHKGQKGFSPFYSVTMSLIR